MSSNRRGSWRRASRARVERLLSSGARASQNHLHISRKSIERTYNAIREGGNPYAVPTEKSPTEDRARVHLHGWGDRRPKPEPPKRGRCSVARQKKEHLPRTPHVGDMLVVPKGQTMYVLYKRHCLQLEVGAGALFFFMGAVTDTFYGARERVIMTYILFCIPSLEPVFCDIEELYKLKCVASAKRFMP